MVMSDLIKRAADMLFNSRYAIALTGAGISTESGIPDFRGPNGIWTKNPEMERRAYEMYHIFLDNPKEYWVSRLTNPYMPEDMREAIPNAGHLALASLENLGFLKAVITQNIDGLHVKAGSKRVLEYHGSIDKFRCSGCNQRFERHEFDVFAMLNEGRLPPVCPSCHSPVKDDVVHFNEAIPSDVAQASIEEVNKSDMILICGTSAVVYPFAGLPEIAKSKGSRKNPSDVENITIIEINSEPTRLTREGISDFLIQGSTSIVLSEILARANV
jgi:NAD-dependent deacetylase